MCIYVYIRKRYLYESSYLFEENYIFHGKCWKYYFAMLIRNQYLLVLFSPLMIYISWFKYKNFIDPYTNAYYNQQ